MRHSDLSPRQQQTLDWIVGNGGTLDRDGAKKLNQRWNYTIDSIASVTRVVWALAGAGLVEATGDPYPVQVTQLGKQVANRRGNP